MESNAAVEFSYKPGIRWLLWATVALGIVAVVSEFMALTVDHGVYWRGFYVDTNQATAIYSVMVVASAALSMLGFVKLNWSLNGGGKIGLTETELMVSGFFSSRKIAYSSIRELRLVPAKARFLRIRTASGKLDINEHWLPKGAFDRICKFVEQRSNPAVRSAWGLSGAG
jgi:hypothetical protein